MVSESSEEFCLAPFLVRGSFSPSFSSYASVQRPWLTSVSDPDAIKERPGSDGVGVAVGGHAGLAEDIRNQRGECWERNQVNAALQEIVHAGDALPGHNDPAWRAWRDSCACGREEAQGRKRVSGIGQATPLLPIVVAVGVRIRRIRVLVDR